MFDFELGPIRPPSEADSLLIRTTRGCPWNRCAFCTLYKGASFSIRSVEDIKQDILAAKKYYKGRSFENCFLQDGDSFAMETDDLIEVLTTLKLAFPELKQVSSYGRAQSMAKKSLAEMKAIRKAGLNMLYCGMESGSVEVLKKMKKGITPKSILKSSLHAKEAGMKMMIFVILGLGGKALSAIHVKETAELLNQIDPDEIRVLSLAVKPDTELAKMVDNGSFTMLSEVEMIREQQQLLNRLDGINSRYGNYHAINLLMEINGKLPEDKAELQLVTEQFLSLTEAEQLNFIFGRRAGYYRRLADLKNLLIYDRVQMEVEKIQQKDSDAFATIVHDLRKRLI